MQKISSINIAPHFQILWPREVLRRASAKRTKTISNPRGGMLKFELWAQNPSPTLVFGQVEFCLRQNFWWNTYPNIAWTGNFCGAQLTSCAAHMKVKENGPHTATMKESCWIHLNYKKRKKKPQQLYTHLKLLCFSTKKKIKLKNNLNYCSFYLYTWQRRCRREFLASSQRCKTIGLLILLVMQSLSTVCKLWKHKISPQPKAHPVDSQHQIWLECP